jgi:hypothetical protein
MANRTAKCAVAIFASVFASTPVTIVASSSARAADDCLTEPQGQAPQGQHWFYRTEHGTKQRCWYLRDQSDKSAQTDSSADAAAPSQGNEPATSLSTTDSYAELPAQHPRADQNGGASAARRAPANTSTAANVRDNSAPSANAPIDSVFGPPPVVSGSPETSGMNSSANPPPETSAAGDTSTTPEPDAASVPAPPVAAAPVQKAVGSLQMLLLVIFGALTLVGLSGSLVYRLGRARQTARAAQRRRDIWRSADTERRKAWKNRQAKNSAAARADFAYRPGSSSRADSRAGGVDDRWTAGMDADGMDAGGLDDKVERVEAFLSQLSKLAQSDAQSRPPRRTRA